MDRASWFRIQAMVAVRSHRHIVVFGPWLVPLFGVGAVLLVGGLLTKEMASDRSIKGLGRGAANVGWRLMLLAAAMYLGILTLTAVFESMVSNLPGT